MGMGERGARQTAIALIVLGAAGCTGTLISEPPPGGDAGPGVILMDSGPPLPGVDAGPLPPGVDGGPPRADAGPPAPGVDAGPPRADAGPLDRCAAVTCMANASCDPATGMCVCQAGFVEMGGACVSLPPDDPAVRTQADVCAEWQAGHVQNASSHWNAGAGSCGAGTMPMAAIDDTLRRVNLFRWLAGMENVSYDGADHAGMQECAHIMSVNGMLSHDPPMSWSCWTSGGAAAAGRSNIAWGYGSPGAAIDGYMTDVGVMSLGHRRWILGQRLSSVEVGFSSGGPRPGQCLGVFSRGGTSTRAWTAYPNQGFAPMGMLMARGTVTWSFQANSFSLPSGTTAEVVRVSDGMNLPVTSYLTGGGGPPPSVGFTPSGWTPQAGQTYRVTIRGTSMGDITYETTLVDC